MGDRQDERATTDGIYRTRWGGIEEAKGMVQDHGLSNVEIHEAIGRGGRDDEA